jgi:hypothetical protein
VFDRVTGQPLWPIEERPVPASDIPGEQAWPTQPFPTVVPPFGRQRFSLNDVNPYLRSTDYSTMYARVASARNNGLFTPPALIDTISTRQSGGSNWGTTAANPEKGIVYVLNVDAVAILKLIDVRQNIQSGLSTVFGSAVSVLPGLPRTEGAAARCLAHWRSRTSSHDSRRMPEDGDQQRAGIDAPVAGITDAELNAVVAC